MSNTVAYPAAALADRQPSIMTLIPRRRWTLVVILLAGLSVIAAFEAAYGNLLLWPQELWPCACRSLDLRARGELAACFSFVLLAATAIQSLLIYRLRRHRLDDYRGRYRLWTWIPLVWIGMGLGVSTHAGDDLADLVARLCGAKTSQATALWTPLVLGSAWLMISTRLAIEVRRSRTSLAFLVIATCGYLTANLVGSGLLAPTSEVLQVMTVSSAAMVGYLATFLAIATYSRHVFLEAHGMLAARSRTKAATKRKRAPAAVKADESSKPTKTVATESASRASDQRESVVAAAESRSAPTERKTPAASPKSQPEPAQRPAGEPRVSVGGQASPKSQPAPTSSRPPASPTTKDAPGRPAALPRDTDEDEEDAQDDGRDQTSKAERRRLRKLGRRDQPIRRAA
ncbi:MAG: hypothetical protein NTY19_40760 [Planctomycetota bacterium]|nr:hypothetical protein [Planctomycetota bacterium]